MKSKKHFLTILGIFLILPLMKAQSLLPKLQKLFGQDNVIYVDSSAYREYYRIDIPQLIDHNDPRGGTFLNRILLGFNEDSAPVVMESGPYGFYPFQEKITYKTELTQLLDANQIIVEHRFFGKSIPDSTTYTFLTYKQASDDFHYIREMFNSIFPKKWIATGHSKGGDAVFAYKYYYPSDVEATVAYGISTTLAAEDLRFENYIAKKRNTEDGKKLFQDQLYLLKNKKRLLPAFIKFNEKVQKLFNIDYGTYDAETMYDYAVLDLDAWLWQNFGNYDSLTKQLTTNDKALREMGIEPETSLITSQDKLVYFLDLSALEQRSKTHLYQAFSEGGYYGYDERPFAKYLKNKDYPLSFFAGEKTNFDPTFRQGQQQWAATEMEHFMLIIGDTDPWGICCPIPFPKVKDNLKLVLKNSSHSTKLKDFNSDTREAAVQKLKSWLKSE